MVETNFLKTWEKLLGNTALVELAIELENADGYLSEIHISDSELEEELLFTKIIEKNMSGGCYPGENFCAFMNQLDNPIN